MSKSGAGSSRGMGRVEAMSSSIQRVEENSTGSEEHDRLIKEFVLITKTDSKVATFFLENHDWDLKVAIPDYFNLAGEIKKEDKSGLFSEPPSKSEKWVAELNQESKVVSTFSFISWNIDGLDDRNFQRRTDNLINILKEEQADVIFLQEVIDLSMNQIVCRLTEYQSFMQNNGDNYFVVTLIKKDSVKYISHKEEQFHNSVMGRGMLSVEVEVGGIRLWLHNMHLESTADFKQQRVEQLKLAFTKLTSNAMTHSTIVAGDLNLRDSEVGLTGGIPDNCIDVWEACDRREECRYTWDSARNSNCLSKGGGPRGNFKPRLRFDRVYLHCCKGSSAPFPTPKHFKLLGVSKVPNLQCYTSDHWALQIFFTINKH